MVRYDAKSKRYQHRLISRWSQNGQLIKICPEVAAGLPIPRPAAEIKNGGGFDVLRGEARVQLKNGKNITAAFVKGADIALNYANEHQVQFALLKENSPSCGNEAIYNGDFNGTLSDGIGVTAALLKANGIRVFNEHQLDALALNIETYERNQSI